MEYQEFLKAKSEPIRFSGVHVNRDALHPALFDFQRDLVHWSLRKGRAALFADTGLGKTICQLVWATHAAERVLIFAPLAVALQTVKEAGRFSIVVTYARTQAESPQVGITITNYERLDNFDVSLYGAVVLDESSILKSFEGKTRTKLIEACANVPMRLCCTATPAPNDIQEIANHAEFLGIMSREGMLATFFVHDDKGWRLKGHAKKPFYKWLASWAMAIRKPSDLGYDDTNYTLPGLTIEPVIVKTDWKPEGMLFATELKGITQRSEVRKSTLDARVQAVADLVASEPDETWLIWGGLNDETDALERATIAVQVKGSDDPDYKAATLLEFAAGNVKRLVSKVSIAGYGLNFQTCARMVFCGLGDSYEDYYQAIRRIYRYGQTQPVKVYIVLSEPEQAIYWNVLRKEKEARDLMDGLIKEIAEFEKAELGETFKSDEYKTNGACGKRWDLRLGDSTERLRELPNNSVDLTVFSPPFSELYTYSNSLRDLGNSANSEQFLTHFGYLVDELLRVVKPGRIAAVHVFDIPAMLNRDGYIGIKDFSGDVLRLFVSRGWIFDARIPIDKNQQAQSIRTHSKGLTMTQMEKDRSWSRPALPDYILKFRKPGENQVPVRNGDVTRDLWIEWANPTWPNEDDRCAEFGGYSTWYGIRETDTLKVAEARTDSDEKHICALQLGTIERCIKLWSNEGELVLDPFSGIGSTVYQAVFFHRRGIGIELKPEYWQTSVKNLKALDNEILAQSQDMFSLAGIQVG